MLVQGPIHYMNLQSYLKEVGLEIVLCERDGLWFLLNDSYLHTEVNFNLGFKNKVTASVLWMESQQRWSGPQCGGS